MIYQNIYLSELDRSIHGIHNNTKKLYDYHHNQKEFEEIYSNQKSLFEKGVYVPWKNV